MSKQRVLEMNVVHRKILLKRYSHSMDSQFVESLHNKHIGKRCFIIGNGPSLKPSDLDQIKGEYSFATNRIYCIYNKTKWRPTYYMCIDVNVIADEIKNIKQIGNYPKLINYKASKYGRKKTDNIWYVCLKGVFHIDPFAMQTDTLNDDASKYLSWVHTVTVNAIEMAVYMGFKELYLLGVDNTYMLKRDKDGRVYRDPNVKADHFEGMKAADGKLHQGESFQVIDALNGAYELAKKFADEHDVKIYNVTRGGELEVFERVNFDELF